MKNRDSWRMIKNFCLWIIIGIVPPILLNFGMSRFTSIGSDDGWLGFWGGYLGAAITVIGVYVQIYMGNKSAKKLEAIKSRPYVYLNSESAEIFKEVYFKNSEDRDEIAGLYRDGFSVIDIDDKQNTFYHSLLSQSLYLSVHNVSMHHVISMDLILKYEPTESNEINEEKFHIRDIEPFGQSYFYIGKLSKFDDLRSIELYFLTEFHEKIKLFYTYDKETKAFNNVEELNVYEEDSKKERSTFEYFNPSAPTKTVGLKLLESDKEIINI